MSKDRRTNTEAGEQSRSRIIAVPRKLIADSDLNSLKLDRVAERSGVAKSSILWYFGSKNGLLLAVVEDIFISVQTWIVEIDRSQMSGAAYLKAAMERLSEGFQKHLGVSALLISFITNKTIDEAY